jgi:glutamate-1-semialdehyde aminotransferase
MIPSQDHHYQEDPNMISICCTLPKDDYKDLLPEQKQRFGNLVHQLRKKGILLPEAQARAYSQMWSEEIHFD